MRKRNKAIIRAVALFLVFMGLEVLYENRELIDIEGSSCETLHADPTPPFYEKIYPMLLRLRSQTTSGQVGVVFIPQEFGEVQENLCVGRSYLAALITALGSLQPSAIVIDKYFSQTACKEIDPATSKLRYSSNLDLAQAVAALKIPVIIGQSTSSARQERDGSCLQENADQFDFKPAYVTHGLTKLNANREQIPLRWRVLRDASDTVSVPTDSLSLTAAMAVPFQVANKQRLHEVLDGARHPYAQLDLELPTESSQAVVCSSASGTAKKHWGCSSTAPMYVAARDKVTFNPMGKVIVIGSQNEIDHWPVFGKRRWGYELQAAYLEALLSGNYYRAAGGKFIFALSLLFLFLLEAVPASVEYHYSESKKKLPAFWADAQFWIMSYSLVFVAVVTSLFLWRGYLPPLSLLCFALLTLFGRLLFIWMDHYKELITPHKEESSPHDA